MLKRLSVYVFNSPHVINHQDKVIQMEVDMVMIKKYENLFCCALGEQFL